MQRGSLAMVSRKEAPSVWQLRWSEKNLHGVRVQRKRVIGSVERYPDEAAARSAVTVLLAEINSDKVRMSSRSITMAQLCDHFEQRELARDNTWRSYATKKTYHAYLTRWIRPHWRHYELAEIRTIQVESWLRTLPLAKSSCAKIRNLMSVLFNHACRYELFDRNPIYLVRQSAKRRRAPTVLVPSEIKALVDSLGIRERTLVLLAVSTGLRQSELFGLKWGDVDFAQKTMNVTRSFVYGVVGPCKTEASQKPVPVSSNCFENSQRMETNMPLQQVGRLGFCKQTAPWQDTLLGPSHFAKIHSSGRAAGRNSEAIRMAHVSTYVLDSPALCGNRVQSDGGTVTAFNSAIHAGCLHPGTRAGQTCSSGSDLLAGIFGRSKWNVTAVGTK